jgi:hypothetical protein
MDNIWDVYQYNLTRLNKEQSGRSLTQDEFNRVIPVAVYEYFKQKIGLPEAYQVGMPLSPQQWQLTQKISDDCRHLLVWMGGPDKQMLKMDTYGVANVPTDYVAFSSCYFPQQYKKNCDDTPTEKPRTIEFLPDAVWADRLSSPVKKPTEKYPVAKWFGNKIQFAPSTLGYVHFTYLREPVEPFLAVTEDDNNDYVYDAANSVQIEFPKICLPDIANMVLNTMAQQIQSPLFIQTSQQRKIQGI